MTQPQSMDKMLDIAALPFEALSQNARRMAGFSLFDWMVVARAGADQELSGIIRNFALDEGGKPAASIVGSSVKLPARAAALVNGTISHSLDYDDTHFAHIGHLSVGILPAALAAGEEVDAPATSVRDAFLLGAETACRIGMVLGRGHYQRGFHQTATAGTFGATIAAGRIYGLDRAQMRNALSLAATRASGLKSQFGTMGKPFNAGIAAANGVEAAALARHGFISCDDGVGGVQGFVDTHCDAPDHVSPWMDMPPGTFIFEDNKYKLHACCHGTHAMIEALRQGGFSLDHVRRIEVATHPRWLRVCDVKEPRTGLEVKFSYVHLAAMVLSGIDTASEKTYVDQLCADAGLKRLAALVAVSGDESLSDTGARVSVSLTDGRKLELFHDLASRIPADTLERGLRGKARGLLGDAAAERIWSGISGISSLSARELAGMLNA